MGKSKKRSRASSARTNPLLKNAAKDDQLRRKRIQPLIHQLSSTVPNERSMALSTITVLSEDPHMRSLFLKEKLVNVISSKLLTDSNTDIMVEAYGLLRNLALEEGYDLATHLWRLNVWVNVESGLSQVEQSLQSMESTDAKSSKESKRLLYDFADNLLSLLVALLNGSDAILADFMGSNKVNKVFSVTTALLKYGMDITGKKVSLKVTTKLFNTILDFIYDVSSDSADFIEKLSEHEDLSLFVERLIDWEFTNDNELTKVLIQGIYLQFMDLDISYEIAADIISKVLQSVQHIDLPSVFSVLSSKNEDEELMKASNDQISEKIQQYTKKRTEASMKLQSIEIGLDIITASIELIGSKYEESGGNSLGTSLLELLTNAIPSVLLALHKQITARVLIAWNNLLWLYLSVGINVFELADYWKQLWNSMQDSSDDDDFGIRIGKLSVTWALLKSIQANYGTSNVGSFFQEVPINNEQFVNLIIKAFQEVSDLDIEQQVELQQRCGGVLGALSMFQNQVELNGLIGDFFINVLSNKESKAAVLVDFMNTFFDIYSDKNFDYDASVFVERDFLSKLETLILPNLKEVFKFVDKNKDARLKDACQDCLVTLDKFISYKKTERY